MRVELGWVGVLLLLALQVGLRVVTGVWLAVGVQLSVREMEAVRLRVAVSDGEEEAVGVPNDLDCVEQVQLMLTEAVVVVVGAQDVVSVHVCGVDAVREQVEEGRVAVLVAVSVDTVGLWVALRALGVGCDGVRLQDTVCVPVAGPLTVDVGGVPVHEAVNVTVRVVLGDRVGEGVTWAVALGERETEGALRVGVAVGVRLSDGLLEPRVRVWVAVRVRVAVANTDPVPVCVWVCERMVGVGLGEELGEWVAPEAVVHDPEREGEAVERDRLHVVVHERREGDGDGVGDELREQVGVCVPDGVRDSGVRLRDVAVSETDGDRVLEQLSDHWAVGLRLQETETVAVSCDVHVAEDDVDGVRLGLRVVWLRLAAVLERLAVCVPSGVAVAVPEAEVDCEGVRDAVCIGLTDAERDPVGEAEGLLDREGEAAIVHDGVPLGVGEPTDRVALRHALPEAEVVGVQLRLLETEDAVIEGVPCGDLVPVRLVDWVPVQLRDVHVIDRVLDSVVVPVGWDAVRVGVGP